MLNWELNAWRIVPFLKVLADVMCRGMRLGHNCLKHGGKPHRPTPACIKHPQHWNQCLNSGHQPVWSIQELRNTGLSHYKYLWKVVGVGKNRNRWSGALYAHHWSRTVALEALAPCAIFKVHTYQKMGIIFSFWGLVCFSFMLRITLYFHKNLAWFFFFTLHHVRLQNEQSWGKNYPCHKYERKCFRAWLGRKRISRIF